MVRPSEWKLDLRFSITISLNVIFSFDFFQPFEERQKWFYENLFKQNNQDGQGSYNIDERNVIEVKRGNKLLLYT